MFPTNSDLITKKQNRPSGKRIRQILCLCAWGVVVELEDKNKADNEADDSDVEALLDR